MNSQVALGARKKPARICAQSSPRPNGGPPLQGWGVDALLCALPVLDDRPAEGQALLERYVAGALGPALRDYVEGLLLRSACLRAELMALRGVPPRPLRRP